MTDSRIKNSFVLFFLFLGFLSIVLQIFFMRELLTLTGGNEIIIGIIIFWWFLFAGIGSLVKFKTQQINKLLFFIITSYFILGCFLLVDFFLIKFIPSRLHFAGELIPLSWAMLSLPIILFPICFLLGLEFRLGSQLFSLKFGSKASGATTNKAHLFESAGFVVGGLAFSFFLVHFLNTQFIGLILACLALLSLTLYFVLFRNINFKKILMASLLMLAATIVIIPKTSFNKLNRQTLKWQYKNQEIVKSVNSRYGNIVITKMDEQYNFYIDGYFLGPTENIKETEEITIIPLLSQKKSSNILIIGEGWNGLIQEILKIDKVENITYLEIDKVLVENLKNYLPEIQSILDNPKVNLVTQDVITFLKANDAKYDVIILSQPPPMNFLFNRFYTQNFFTLIKDDLKPTGVFAFGLPGLAENMSNPHEQQFLGSVHKTLNKEFDFVKVLPADKMLFLASDQKIKTVELVAEFNKLNLNTSFVTIPYIKYLFEDERTQTINKVLTKSDTFLNKDLQPFAFLAYTKFWSQIYSSKIARAIDLLFNNRIIIISILSLAIILLLILSSKKNRKNSYLFFSIIFASATLMVLEITIILLWQVLFGYIYSQIALILTIIMAGVTFGNYVIVKKKWHAPSLLKKLQKIFIILIASFLALTFWPDLFNQIILGLYAFAFGFINGAIFPLTNKLYLEKTKNPATETGKIYGVELVGSGVLILMFNLFLLPMFGFGVSLVFLVGLNLLVVATE
ncbi:hypothetical protein KKD19_03325 [Patescibacteria group bacterium]|nr:hypothetical protein [Patescibacteria group bacterium]MBU4512247.1 hypothetical protein [Patescibacteria group bacterium]MCG2692665.1 hypothetical protein [Candidatus Parcubacteria bacterium]